VAIIVTLLSLICRIMLDFFVIFSKGGILLWCFKGAGILQREWDAFSPSVNTFIKTVLLQEKSGNKTSTFESGSLAMKYRLDNEFELVFIAAYQKMIPLLYLDKLLDEIQLRFRDRFAFELKSHAFSSTSLYQAFTSEFEKVQAAVENRSKDDDAGRKMKTFEESYKSKITVASMIENPTNNNSKKKSKAVNKQAAQEAVTAAEDPDYGKTEAEIEEERVRLNRERMMAKVTGAKAGGGGAAKVKSPKAGKKPKAATKWDPVRFGGSDSNEIMKSLDRSAPSGGQDTDHMRSQYIPDADVVGRSAQLQDFDDQSSDEEEVEAFEQNNTQQQQQSSGRFGLWSSLSSLVGSKQLSGDDIAPVIAKMQDHLIAKNVAADVAINLCKSVANKLEGKVMGTFQTVHRTVKDSLTDSLMQLLTPRRRVDIIRDVMEAKRNKRPYVMTFCGVNGVGKSTNLAKICFWLLENNCRVLVAACDTFRAGAVEQLRTHTKRLSSLYPVENQPDGKPVVELYEKGYGKDAAGIAMEAISYARQAKIDVVLVDTAGRMQDNEPLMRALAKLISVNDPDLVLFVGEALVGNEAVDQLVKFNQALADHSPSHTNPHLIDGIVLSKFDTIDDKVGSAISMTYITGQPILFVGTGQTYTDLKSLNSKAVVQALMK